MFVRRCHALDRMDRARRRTDRKELPGAGFVPEGNRLAMHFLESVTSISKIQDAIVKEFGATLGMLFREFSKPPGKIVASLCHRLPPSGNPFQVVFLANAQSDRSIHAQ